MSSSSLINGHEPVHDSEVLSSPDPNMHTLFKQHGAHLSNSTYGKNWTQQMSVNLRDYAYKANMYSWQTGQDAFYWNRFGRTLVMWASILSVISTLGFGPIIGLVNMPDLRWLFYTVTVINGLLVLTVAILNNMHLVYNISTKVVEHLEKSAKFGALFRRIKDQFFMPVGIRYNAKTLLDFVSERYNELTAEKLFIRSVTDKNWGKQVPRRDNGDINYDAILLLPEEVRLNVNAFSGDHSNDDFVVNIDENERLLDDVADM